MLVLDTDHLSELDRGGAAVVALLQRLDASGDDVATTIVSGEEQLRGWLSQIHAEKDPQGLVGLYRRLHSRIEYFATGTVLPWDDLITPAPPLCRHPDDERCAAPRV